MKRWRTCEQCVLAVFILGSLAFRLTKLTGPLDSPEWRQATTAYMAYRMAAESPPELFHPKVVYRGPQDVRISEFPIYSFLVALAYKAMGVEESLPAARTVSLLFYLGAAWYLFRIVERVLDRRTALLTTAVYFLLPLGIVYSRAVHYDICLVFFSHAFCWYAMRFFDTRRAVFFIVSTLMGTMAFLMKAPYAFYFGLPLAVFALYPRENRTLRTLLLLGGLFVLPLASAWGFNEYRIAVERSGQQGILQPQTWTHTSSISWFFGDLAMRLRTNLWKGIILRALYLVLTPFGLFAAALAPFRPWPAEKRFGAGFVLALTAGVGCYVLLVFYMVATHSYYSLPLLVPAAILIGISLESLATSFGKAEYSGAGVARLAVTLILLTLGVAQGLRRGSHIYGVPFFHVDWQRIRAGEVIAAHTEKDDVVFVTSKHRSMGETDPEVLYHAKRRGWGRNLDDMNAERLAAFIQGGASHAALLLSREVPADSEQYALFKTYPRRDFALEGRAGEPLGYLVLFNLRGGNPAAVP
ncbi:MAG: glycosyltransferase family 39 protein [Phycisphaerae bacterium]|nr:glycosyltransferase family 39 protein [Phycisphaerae bacterium]